MESGRAKRQRLAEARAERERVAHRVRSERTSKNATSRYDTPGRKQAYLDALREGHTKIDARKAAAREVDGKLIPLTDMTVRKWRERDPIFAKKADEFYFAFHKNPGDNLAGHPLTGYDGSFKSFRKVFFGYDTPKHQQKMVSVLDRSLQSKRTSITLMLLPPAAGKTSTLEDWICMRLALDPDLRIGIVSSTDKHGRKMIGKLKKRFTSEGSSFVMQYGPFHEAGMEKQGKPWASDHITVYKNDSDERDYSLVAFGWNGSMIGTRWDILIVDDIQPYKQLSQTDNILSTFRQDIYTRLGPDCPVVFAANRVGMGDVYDEMLAIPGFVDELIEIPAMDDDNESYWPEKWPKEVLEQRRIISGEDVWWRNYMQRPKASGKGSFPESLVEASKDKLQDHRRPSEAVGVLIGTDPALGGGCAQIAAAYTEDWLCFLDLDYSFQLPGVESIIEIGDELAVRYKAGIWVIETNAMQKGIVRDQRLDKLASQHNYRIVPHQTGTLKTDPTWGVGTMADSMRRGELRIADGNDYCKERLKPLCEQLISWRGDVPSKNLRQDCVMAAWFVHKWWKENRMFNQSTQNFFRTSHKLPYRPTSYHQRVSA